MILDHFFCVCTFFLIIILLYNITSSSKLANLLNSTFRDFTKFYSTIDIWREKERGGCSFFNSLLIVIGRETYRELCKSSTYCFHLINIEYEIIHALLLFESAILASSVGFSTDSKQLFFVLYVNANKSFHHNLNGL